MTETLPPINRGSDLNLQLRFEDGEGDPIDLTGYTVAAFEAHAKLAPHLTLTISNAAYGEVIGRIEWSDAMPTGNIMSFRVRVSKDGSDISSPLIMVPVQ